MATAVHERRLAASGARSGAILAVASGVSIVLNYAFLLAAGRVLGSASYGSLAALLGVLAVVLIPAGAVQMAVSREISRLLAAGDVNSAGAFTRATLRRSTLATIPLTVIGFALAAPLAHVLHIHSVGVVLLAETTLLTAFVFPAALGVMQGSQRFYALAAMYVVPLVVRLVVFGIAAAAGFRLGGAVFASVLSSFAGIVLALVLIRGALRPGPAGAPDLRPFLHYLAPVAVGLIGIALLTHVDVLIVKARFSADEAGAYAGASAFARVAFFLPATILTVLFPRTAARQARGQQTEDILGRSLLATVLFCGALVLFYAAAGVGLVSTTFGPGFAEGGTVLAPFTLAISLFSIANILVGYHLSRGEVRYAWIVAAGVIFQVVLLATLPSSLHGVVWTNVAVGAVLLVAHEVFVGSSIPAVRSGLESIRGFAARAAAIAPEAGLVLLGNTLFVCALFGPVVAHLGSTIVGSLGSDSTGSVAWFWLARHESGFHLLGTTHHTLTGAPLGWDDTNALNLQVLLPYYPTYLLAHVVGDVAAYNLTLLAGYVLSGATMYALVRYLGCARVVAAWAALAAIVFPWHLARAEHVSLLHIEVLALLIFTLVAMLRRPSWVRAGFIGVANLACWLTSGYFGAIAMVTTVAFTLGAALVSRRRGSWLLVLGSIGAAFGAIVILGIAAVASGTNAGAGLKRQSGDLAFYGLHPVELVVPPVRNIVLGNALQSFWSRHSHGSNRTEITNYLGLLTIALAVGWLVVAFRRRRRLAETERVATGGLVAAFLVGLAFAAPSPVHVFGHRVTMPSRLLWDAVPAFRVPSRWDPLLMTALIPLAALGLHALYRRLEGRRRGIAFGVVGAAMAFSFIELSIHPAEPRFRTTPVPAEYGAVERMPEGVLAEYPLGYSDVYRLWQTQHGRPLLDAAPFGSTNDATRLMLLDPADPGTAPALSFLGVTALAIHPGAQVDSEVLPREPTTGKDYELVGRFPDGASVWKVIAAPAPAIVTLPGGFAKPRRSSDGVVTYPLVSTAGVGVLQIRAKRAGVIRLVFDVTAPPGSQRALRVADSQHEQAFTITGRTHVEVTIQVPAGVSQLLLKTDPPPTSEADALELTAPRAVPASEAAALHPDLVSPDPGF